MHEHKGWTGIVVPGKTMLFKDGLLIEVSGSPIVALDDETREDPPPPPPPERPPGSGD